LILTINNRIYYDFSPLIQFSGFSHYGRIYAMDKYFANSMSLFALKRCALTLSHISLQDKIAFLFK